MTLPQQILVAVDFSETSDRARDYALDLARQVGASVELVHVFQWPVYATSVENQGPTQQLLDGLQRELEASLEHQKESSTHPEVHVKTTMRKGVPHEAIVEQADKSGADLIVIGTHGRTGLAHALLGSVAERVIRTSPIPVLTVGPRSSEGA